jgi:hypothetical protein
MTRRLTLAPLLALTIGCTEVGFEDTSTSVRTALINCTTNQLGIAPLLNSCGLGWVGPFGDEDGTGSDDDPIAASANVNFTAAEPALHAPQVVYTVNLPGNANTGAVKFTAVSSQDYSVVTDAEVTLVIRDSGGAVVSPLFLQDIEATCDAAADAFPAPLDGVPMVGLGVYQLTAGTTYVITFQNSSEDEFHVAIDEPNDFLNVYFPDADGDGFGNYRGTPIVTECSTPAGHADDGDDCDDSNSSVFPGAPEVPGMGDNNCDRVPDGDIVGTDLAIRDVVVLNAPTELALGGRSGLVEVRYRYVNRGPALMDALVTMNGSGSTNMRVRPGETTLIAEDLMPVRIEEHVQRYKVKCKRPHHRRHHRPPPANEVRTLTFSAEIEPADPADIDSLPANNFGEASVDVTCVDCKQFRRSCRHDHHGHDSHGRHDWNGHGHGHGHGHDDIPAVCRKRGRGHHLDRDDHGHGHDHGRGHGYGRH